MRADQAKTIAIDQYLSHVEGVLPANTRRGGKELWYHSPLRAGDSSPSFKVDTELNLWHDHGLGQGGNVLDLVCAVRNASVREALAVLDRSGLYQGGYSRRTASGMQRTSRQTAALFDTKPEPKHQPEAKPKPSEANKTKLLSVEVLDHPQLLAYLQSRCIDLDIAKTYLKQIRVQPNGKLAEYFALGWSNGEGYEARNRYFKGFVGTGKNISIINPSPNADVLVFEGFMDFLSYLTWLKQQRGITKLQSTVVVLNSVSLKKRLLDVAAKQQPNTIYLFLDNDEPGRLATDYFVEVMEDHQVIDKSSLYADHQDFNAMLCASQQSQS